MPVILATWEAAIRRIAVLRQQTKSLRDPISINSRAQWHVPVIPIYVVGWRIMVPGQSSQNKVCETPSQWEKKSIFSKENIKMTNSK
jgi:hypothetical protein